MEGIIGFVSCLFCAFPLFIIGHYDKDSREPIVFWAGDKTLKKKIKNVHDYNCDMSKLYIKCSLFFVLTGITCMICFWLGITCIMVGSTLGIYIVWKKYKNILSKYV